MKSKLNFLFISCRILRVGRLKILFKIGCKINIRGIIEVVINILYILLFLKYKSKTKFSFT